MEPTTALAVRAPQALTPYIPQDYTEAMKMATTLGKAAGLIPEVAYLKMAAGAAYGVDPVTALRLFDVIDGPGGTKQPSPRAQALAAFCLRATSVCEYFESVESDATHATWRTKRVGRPERVVTFTMEDAQRAKLVKPGGAYEKDPESQFNARASSRLARLVFPDVINNMYSTEELRDATVDEPRDVTPSQVQPLTPAATTVADAQIVRAPETDEAAERRLKLALIQAASLDAAAQTIKDIQDRWKDGPPRDRLRAVLKARKDAAWAVAVEEPAHDPDGVVLDSTVEG